MRELTQSQHIVQETTIFFRGTRLLLLNSENMESKGSRWNEDAFNYLLSLEELFVFNSDISAVTALDVDMVVICKLLQFPNFQLISHWLAFQWLRKACIRCQTSCFSNLSQCLPSTFSPESSMAWPSWSHTASILSSWRRGSAMESLLSAWSVGSC